jgi:hypothetical protein
VVNTVVRRTLERDKRGVALIQVPHRRLDAHRAQHEHASQAQHHFLLNPGFLVAAVQARRQLAIPRRVGLHVGVEQQQAHAPDLHEPDRDRHRAAAKRHLHHAALAGRRHGGLNWRVFPVQLLVRFELPAVGGEPLVEVALGVHEADADKRQPEIARFLAGVPREDAKAAGVDGQ